LLLEFVWRIAEKLNHEGLRRWVIKQVDFRYKLEDLKKQMLRERLEEGRQTVYLMIEILKDLNDELQLQSWVYRGEKGDPLPSHQCADKEEALHEAVCRILDDLESGDQGDLAIELFVETRMLNCCAEEREYMYAPLGSKYPLVLRWRARLLERSPLAGRWCSVAEWIHDQMGASAQPSILWVPDDVSDYRKLAARIHRQFDHSFLGFTDKQVDERDGGVDSRLMAALVNGAPYAFFPRKQVAANFKPAFIKKINELENWDDLPKALMEMRRESIGDDGHPAAKVTLLWDDPRRKLPRTISLSIKTP
jgi:hypothetical protein